MNAPGICTPFSLYCWLDIVREFRQKFRGLFLGIEQALSVNRLRCSGDVLRVLAGRLPRCVPFGKAGTAEIWVDVSEM